MTKILLLEDDASLGATLRDRLIKEGYEVVWTENRRSFDEAIKKDHYDLFVLDVGLPDGNGFEVARSLSGKPLIFLTAQSDAESRLKGYDLGAEEFIPKPFHLRELLMRIRHVLENHSAKNRLELGDLSIDFDGFEVVRGGVREAAATRDLMLLKLMVTTSPKVVSRDQALDCIRGDDKFPSNRTVDNAIVRLRSLLGNHADRIESVRGIGYRWVERKST